MVVETIFASVGTWLATNYAKPIAGKLAGVAKDELIERWEKFNWEKAEKKYKDKVVSLYGTTRILGKHEPVELEGIFTDAFILDQPTALRRYDINELRKQFETTRYHQQDEKRFEGLSLINQPDRGRLFILGKPGAGKTTFLKHVTQQAVKGKIDKIPIFIPLKEWSDKKIELMPFIVKQFNMCNFPEAQPFVEQLLEKGQAIVLFDGLDEVNLEGGERDKVIDDLNSFSKTYDKCQCLITCRVAATDYSFEHFTYVEVADFNDEQIRIYVKKWFPDKERQEDFFAAFFHDDNEGLRELGRVPLLLSLLCLAFEETLTFPQRRVEIYEEAIDALLKKWDSDRKIKRDEIYRKLSLGRKRQMLARIAAEKFEKGEYLLRQRDLEKQIVDYLKNLPPADIDEDIDGEAVLKAIEAQHGIFVERARRIHSFAHLSFQEYFTAKYIVDNEKRGTVERLFRDHLTDDNWREIFLLTASLLDDADEFFTLFRQSIDHLISDDETLIVMLEWAEREGAKLKLPSIQAKIFCIGYAFISGLIRFDLSLNLSRDAGVDIARALEQANLSRLDLSRDPLVDLARAIKQANRSLEFGVDIARVLSRLIFEIGLAFAFNFILRFVLELLSNLDQADRAASNRDFVPTHDLGDLDHAARADYYRTARARIHKMYTYLTANILLVDCLKLAYVSDRESIENSLLLPPKRRSKSAA